MVSSSFARLDVDNNLLTKTITYRKYDISIDNLAYANQARGTPTSYLIFAQVTIQTMDSKYVQMGIVQAGDIKGLFRYEYTQDSQGNAINPRLIPKKGDEIIFNGFKFVIKDCTPATSEDSGIIGWDFNAGQTV